LEAWNAKRWSASKDVSRATNRIVEFNRTANKCASSDLPGVVEKIPNSCIYCFIRKPSKELHNNNDVNTIKRGSLQLSDGTKSVSGPWKTEDAKCGATTYGDDVRRHRPPKDQIVME
jgi:hypothetical protein